MFSLLESIGQQFEVRILDALFLNQLRKVYANGVEALSGIDLQVKEGDFFALLGPNGAGKTTAIGIVTSLVNKTSGTVSVFGYNLDKEREAAKACIGVVPQEANLNVFEKNENILVNQAGYYGVPRPVAKQRAEKYLKALHVWDRRDDIARNLSGGMKRRLMIARALVHEPRLLILDEPTAGVDIEIRRSMWDLMRELNDVGMTIILTTHYLEEAEYLCDHITIIHKGKILKTDTKENLINFIGKKIVKFNLNFNLKKIPEELKKYNPNMHKNILSLTYDKHQIKLKEILEDLNNHKITFDEINTQESDLEDVFIELTKN